MIYTWTDYAGDVQKVALQERELYEKRNEILSMLSFAKEDKMTCEKCGC